MQKQMYGIIAILLIVFLTSGLVASEKNPFVDVVKNIRGSVVNIKVEYESAGNMVQGMPFDDDFFRFFFRQPVPQQPQSRKAISMGTGFIFKREGNEVFIITNNHVVENGKKDNAEITVTLEDKKDYLGEIVGLDGDTDLAVIKIEIDKNSYVTIAPLGDSDNLEVGQWAIAIGNPFGEELSRTVTVGVISATGRSNFQFGNEGPLYQDYIQTDAAINRGNSGGPLVNIDGEVIGVNAAISTPNQGNVGIGFAIPVNLARKVIQDLQEYGEVVRGYLGIIPQEITPELSKSLTLDDISGVLVAKVEDGTPADKSGMKKGDVIVSFNNKAIENVSKFRIEVADSPIGEKLPVEIIRNGKSKTLNVELEQRPVDSGMLRDNSSEASWLGMKVEEVDGDFASKNKIKEDSGVVITEIEDHSSASRSVLKPGYIIQEINTQEIKDLADFKRISKQVMESNDETVLLYVKTQTGNYLYIAIAMRD
ncbi:MAG: Do family serine endopeptidase [Candidatus Cloacimonetes bacterium]|nr:Do family serine endopeptidase [Candidatus Cloacimonadota bacterium]